MHGGSFLLELLFGRYPNTCEVVPNKTTAEKNHLVVKVKTITKMLTATSVQELQYSMQSTIHLSKFSPKIRATHSRTVST